jgi:hypothetical protein
MKSVTCFRCCNEGCVVVRTAYGKKVVPCPACEDRRLIREYKERARKEPERPDDHMGTLCVPPPPWVPHS